MIILRQSTASQEIPLGYFLDSTDGNTEETGLTIANTDIKVWKTGATTLANKNSGGATHISNGLYYAVLDATDTDTIGPMRVHCHVAGALAVIVYCTVLDEAVYDVLFGTTAPSTLAAGALMGLADSAITSAKFAAGAITAAATAADFGTETAASVWGAALDSYVASGTFGEAMHPSAHGLAVAAGSTTITLDGDAVGVAEYYDGSIIQIVAGTGAGQSRIIRSYTSGKVATITEAWGTNPVAGSQYIIRPLGDVEVGAIMAGIINSTVAPALANLDAAVSTRSTYAGGDTSGTTSLLSRLTALRAGYLDFLDAAISSRLATSGYTAPDNTGIGEANAHAHAIDARLPSDPADESLLEAAIAGRAAAGDAMALTTAAVDAILDEVVEGSTTLRQALRLVLSALVGKVSGAPTGPLLFRDLADSKDRITATVDADGNRTAVTKDAT